jgi:hypothetical protein
MYEAALERMEARLSIGGEETLWHSWSILEMEPPEEFLAYARTAEERARMLLKNDSEEQQRTDQEIELGWLEANQHELDFREKHRLEDLLAIARGEESMSQRFRREELMQLQETMDALGLESG